MARTAIVTRQDAVLLGGWPVAHQARGSVITVRVCVPGFITGALLLTDRLAPLAVWLRHEEPADLPAPLAHASPRPQRPPQPTPQLWSPTDHHPQGIAGSLPISRTHSVRRGRAFAWWPVNTIANQAMMTANSAATSRKASATMWGMARSHLTSGSHQLRSCLASG